MRATVPRLNLLDSGAAVDTSDGVLERDGGYALEGTRGANVIAESTANDSYWPTNGIQRTPCTCTSSSRCCVLLGCTLRVPG